MDCRRRRRRVPPPARTGSGGQRTICSSCWNVSSAPAWMISDVSCPRTSHRVRVKNESRTRTAAVTTAVTTTMHPTISPYKSLSRRDRCCGTRTVCPRIRTPTRARRPPRRICCPTAPVATYITRYRTEDRCTITRRSTRASRP
uniref:(northern house mosquito) hypothetical protein n=1 Tax=Culex pipiens TaxID=7175 RepID=A0A8D8BJ88_CULPI